MCKVGIWIMNSEFASEFSRLGKLNDDVQIALSAISDLVRDNNLKERANSDEIRTINEILIDMTTLMISINHQLLSLPQAIASANHNDPRLTKEQLLALTKATEEEYNRIRQKLTPIVHLLRPY
jgi:hypothetical protein